MVEVVKEPPRLPVETYIHILSFLLLEDSTVAVLVSFLSANPVLRAAAQDPSLWKAHYLARYRHAIEANERARQVACGGDWLQLYTARRTLDRRALLRVDEIRALAGTADVALQQELASEIVREFGMDVVDALERETQVPVPRVFREDAADVEDEDPVPHAFPRRFWAKAVLGAVLRNAAVKKWRAGESFEDLLGGLSAFFTIPPYYVSAPVQF